MNNERTVRTKIGKAGGEESWERGKTGVRNEDYKSGSWRGRYFGHMKFEIMVGHQGEIVGRQWGQKCKTRTREKSRRRSNRGRELASKGY